MKLLIPILAFVFMATTVAASLGNWKPVSDLKDPHLKEIGEFAVSEYDKRSKADLKFESVLEGETQIVSGGINYKLVLSAKSKAISNNFEALIWEIASQGYKNLTSFTPLIPINENPVTAPLPGGWTPIINLQDPHVVDIGKFAVSEHDKQSNDDLKFESILAGETQDVSGGKNYRLVLTADIGSDGYDFEAVVLEKPSQNFRNLTSFMLLYG